MQSEALTDKEREIATKIVAHDRLKGQRVSKSTVSWAAKIASMIEENDPRVAILYENLRTCLLYEAQARTLPKPERCESPENIRAWRHARESFMGMATSAAHLAAEIATRIKGLNIETRALVPLGTCTPTRVLKAAYEALHAQVDLPELRVEQGLGAHL